MALNTNFNELATTTLNLWCKNDFTDVFSSHHPLWYRLRKNGNIQQGGLGIKALEPLMYPDPNGPQVEGVVDPYTQLVPLETTGWTNAEFTWCEKRLSVSIPELIMDQQGSETRKINHLGKVKDLSMMKFMENLNADIWRPEGAAGSNGTSRQYLGSIRTYLNRGGTLTTGTNTPAALIEQVYNANVQPGGAAVGTTPLTLVGNIERNSVGGGYWCTPTYNPGSTDTLSQATINYPYNLAVRGSDNPDLIVTNRANFGTLMSILQNNQRYMEGTLANAGFTSMKYMGAEVVFDDNCPAKNIFFINTKYLTLRSASMSPKFEDKPDPHRTILNWNMRWVGQLTSGNLGRVHSRHANIGS